MIRFLLDRLALNFESELILTTTEAAVAAMLLRLFVVPSFEEKLPRNFRLFPTALAASAGAALDHFASGNSAESSFLTGTLAFWGAWGLRKVENRFR